MRNQAEFDRPLPASVDTERLLLGAAMNDSDAFPQIAGIISADDFSVEKHKRIFLRMGELHERGDAINRVTLYRQLESHGQVESVDGLKYLVSLDEGLPQLVSVEGFCRIIRDKATLRRAIIGAQGLIDQCFNASDEPGDLLRSAERISEILTVGARRKLNARTVGEVIADEGGWDDFLKPDARPGIHVPVHVMNETLSGLRRGKFIVLGARPATGKTALAVQLAEHAALNGYRVVFVSLEMKSRELLHRSITGRAQVSAYKFRTGKLTEIERNGVIRETTSLVELRENLLLVEDSDATVPAIDTLLRSIRGQGKPADLLIVDYLQLLSSVGRMENRVQEVSAISRGLKKLTQRFDIPVLALSQLRRKEHGGDPEPQLHDLKESGQLEQDADQVIFLWTKKEPDELEPSRQISWKVGKNRDGILNRGTLEFFTKYCRFVETMDNERVA